MNSQKHAIFAQSFFLHPGQRLFYFMIVKGFFVQKDNKSKQLEKKQLERFQQDKSKLNINLYL